MSGLSGEMLGPWTRAETNRRMLRRPEWIHGNKQKLESGHKTWNKTCAAIMTGNVIGSGFNGGYIRAYTHTEMPMKTMPPAEPGRLQKFDLDGFTSLRRFPHVRREIEKLTREQGGILYSFSVGDKILGYLLTTTEYEHVRTFYVGGNYKADSVLDYARTFLAVN